MIDEKKLVDLLKGGEGSEKYQVQFDYKEGDSIENIVLDALDVYVTMLIGAIYDLPKVDWIPCESKLPPQPKENPLYENKPLQVYLVSVKSGEEPFRAFWNGKNFTDGWSKLNVEAWMELPQPYKKEGAE